MAQSGGPRETGEIAERSTWFPQRPFAGRPRLLSIPAQSKESKQCRGLKPLSDFHSRQARTGASNHFPKCKACYALADCRSKAKERARLALLRRAQAASAAGTNPFEHLVRVIWDGRSVFPSFGLATSIRRQTRKFAPAKERVLHWQAPALQG
jgi:hypothetical protein